MARKVAELGSDSKVQVLAATLRVVAKGGVDAVRYRAVADEAGVSLGTVSYHYSSREQLIREALTHYLDSSVRELFALRDSFDTPRLADVADYVTELVRRDFADPDQTVLAEYELMVYAARDSEVASALQRYESALVAEMARVLEGLGVRAPFSAARTLAELIRGFELTQLATEDRDLEDFRGRVTTVLSAFAPAAVHQNSAIKKRGIHENRKNR